jgi:DNA-binding NarL/FixJ family response regulator
MVILFISHVNFLREAMVAVLRGDNGLRAVGAHSRETAEAAALEFSPGLVVIDSSHPEGTALVAAVRAHVPKISVVVLAMRERDEDFLTWADIGISGYLGPDTSTGDLINTVRRAGAGEVVCPPRLTALLLNRFADRSGDRATRAGIHALTPREREIVELLADGLPNKLIARRLRVALPTVKNHVHSILDKWDVRSRGEAAARYRRKMQEAEPNGVKLNGIRSGHVAQKESPALRNSDIRAGRLAPSERAAD